MILRAIRERLHWRQLLLALACFALPLAVLQLAALAYQPESPWEPLATWPGDRLVRQLEIGAASGTSLLYATGEVGGLYASSDRGATWQRTPLSAPSGFLGITHLVDLALNPQNPMELYGVVDSPGSKLRPMVYHTLDGGQSWQVRGSLGPRRVRALAFGPQASDLYLAMSNRVVNVTPSSQGTTAFIANEKALDTAPGFALDSQFRITDFVVSGYPTPQDRELAFYLGTKKHGLRVFRGSPRTGFRPVDPGLDSDSLYVRDQAQINSVCYHGLNTAVVCVGTQNGLYASTDGGANWFRTAYALRHQRVTALTFDPANNAIYVGLAAGGIYYSQDQGITWQRLGQGLGQITPQMLALSHGEPRTLYAATNHGIWRLELGP